MMWTDGNAILLIRNPYKAIYGNMHLHAGGHVGYADSSKFFGPGRLNKILNADMYISNKIH